MKPHLTLLAAGLTLLLTGCAHWTKKPAIVAPNETTRYSTASFENDYKDYVAEKDASKSTPLRDRMIQRIRVDIDSWYFNFESDLFAHRAGFDTGADVVELGLAGAASLTNGERAKTILASILTAAKGSRLSIDKNWFSGEDHRNTDPRHARRTREAPIRDQRQNVQTPDERVFVRRSLG